MDVKSYLTSKGIDYSIRQRPVGLVAEACCPVCKSKEKSFGINIVDGAWSCLRLNNCGAKGSWADFMKLFGDSFVQLDSNMMKRTYDIKYIKPKVEIKITDPAIEWMKKRNLSEITTTSFKIGEKDGWLALPYYKNGELVNVKYRYMKEKKFFSEKNGEPVLFGRDLIENFDYIILVEGELDCCSMYQYEFQSVSIPSGAADLNWIEHEWEWLDCFKKIYICMDQDEAGQKNINEIVKRLGEWRCYNVILPYKDANECLMKNITDAKIKECIDNAKGFDPSTLLRAKDFYDVIVDINRHPEKRYGLSTPWQGLTKLLKGLREAELTIWSGRSGAGKSTALNKVAHSLCTKNESVLVVSLEMKPGKYLNWLLSSIMQKSIMTDDEISSGLKELQNLFVLNITDVIKPLVLFDLLEFAARKYGVKHFIIDSLMKIDIKGSDKYEEQKDFCNYLIEKIDKKYNAHTHLVVHPRKGFKDSDKPDKVDVGGSGDITNLADNVIILYRYTEDEKKNNTDDELPCPDMAMYVVKNREHGVEGKVEFMFNPDTKTFTEC